MYWKFYRLVRLCFLAGSLPTVPTVVRRDDAALWNSLCDSINPDHEGCTPRTYHLPKALPPWGLLSCGGWDFHLGIGRTALISLIGSHQRNLLSSHSFTVCTMQCHKMYQSFIREQPRTISCVRHWRKQVFYGKNSWVSFLF